MSIKGLRTRINNELIYLYAPAYLLPLIKDCNYNVEYHTGTYDRNNIAIFEGDHLRSKTCETPFKVENIVDFLIMCGKYEEKHGTPIFESLEIVKD